MLDQDEEALLAERRKKIVYAATELMEGNEGLGSIVLLFTDGHSHVLARKDVDSVQYPGTAINGWPFPKGKKS